MSRIRAKGGKKSGYFAAAIIFAAMTAAWILLANDASRQALTEFGGYRLPVATIASLIVMPLVGLVMGRWRYHEPRRGGPWLLKLLARAFAFTYAHLLLILLTLTVLGGHFLALNIEQEARRLDGSLFDLSTRYAPWLTAYLAGFSVGRALAPGNQAAEPELHEIRNDRGARAEPTFSGRPERRTEKRPNSMKSGALFDADKPEPSDEAPALEPNRVRARAGRLR